MEESKKTRMVPVPSNSIIPERDLGKTPVIECSHLGIDFGGLRAVDDFNFTVGATEIAGLIGPNGAGKTTIFNLLTKVYTPTRGTFLLNGIDTSGKNTVQINKMGVARTFQNIRLFSDLSVEDNVKIGLHNACKYSALTGILRLPGYWKKERRHMTVQWSCCLSLIWKRPPVGKPEAFRTALRDVLKLSARVQLSLKFCF